MAEPLAKDLQEAVMNFRVPPQNQVNDAKLQSIFPENKSRIVVLREL